MTRVRLPDTPVPELKAKVQKLDGKVDELVGLLVSRNDGEVVLKQAQALLHRCAAVIAVDQGSTDDTVSLLEQGGVRVLRLPAAQGEGAALRAGMQLARELGHIGALVPGPELLEPAAVDVLTRAHLRAPEALFMAVGPGEAIAGQEWVEAAMIAEGLEPPALSQFKPPVGDGIVGRVEATFERLVETCYAHPWGSPRVLPLQSMLRRDLQCRGMEFHLESLLLAVLAGIPTIEVEVGSSPQRRRLSCRRVALRLLLRMTALLVRKEVAERFGMGGGYAPPTTSPLGLLLATGLALTAAMPATGCVRNVSAPAALAPACESELPRQEWPAAGEAENAYRRELEARSSRGSLWMQQTVTLAAVGPKPSQQLQGALILGGEQRLRLRLLAPMGVVVLDFVLSGQDWQLSVPSFKLHRRGRGELPSSFEDARGRTLPLRVDLLTGLLQGSARGQSVRWQAGACAILEELDASERVVRRFAWQRSGDGWQLVREELLEDEQLLLVAAYSDYRSVGDSVSWPYRLELRDEVGGSSALMETRFLRTDGVGDEFFAMADMDLAEPVEQE